MKMMMLNALTFTSFFAMGLADLVMPHGAMFKRQAGAAACSSFESIVTSCQAKITGFTGLPASQRASCLCYQSSTLAPSVYDGYLGSCIGYFSSASPSYYSASLTTIQTTPCASIVRSLGLTTSAPITSAPTSSVRNATATSSYNYLTDTNAAACDSLDAAFSSCQSQTPGFTYLAFSSRATCLCYSDNSWAPQTYDSYQSGCLAFIATASPSAYSSLLSNGVVNTPCRRLGNIATITSASSSASTRSTSNSQPVNTGLTTTANVLPTPSGNTANNHSPGVRHVVLAVCLALAMLW